MLANICQISSISGCQKLPRTAKASPFSEARSRRPPRRRRVSRTISPSSCGFRAPAAQPRRAVGFLPLSLCLVFRFTRRPRKTMASRGTDYCKQLPIFEHFPRATERSSGVKKKGIWQSLKTPNLLIHVVHFLCAKFLVSNIHSRLKRVWP